MTNKTVLCAYRHANLKKISVTICVYNFASLNMMVGNSGTPLAHTSILRASKRIAAVPDVPDQMAIN